MKPVIFARYILNLRNPFHKLSYKVMLYRGIEYTAYELSDCILVTDRSV